MDIEEIYLKMKGAVEGASGVRINAGGDMALRLYAVAAEIYSLRVQAEWLEKQGFPQTATGGFLDSHALLRGIKRRSATRAVGKIRFELSEARGDSVSIPAGTVCLNSAGIEFLTDAGAVIPAGNTFCLVSATAREAGSFGNVPVDGIYQMALAPVGVARCYNPEAFSGGTDGETDESLRARVLESFARLPNGSNAAYYETEALNTDGIVAAKALPRARGIGTVDLVVASAQGKPAAGVIASLQSRLEDEREICVDVQVLEPQLLTVNVAATVEVEDGFDAEVVLNGVSAAVSALFDGTLLGKKLLLAKIGSAIFGVGGVSNYKITAPTQDVSVGAKQLPVAGTITIKKG